MALYGSLQLPLWLSLALSGSYWLSVTPTLVPTDSHRHPLAYSGRLLLSNFAFTVLDRLSGPLLGSQRRCHADALCPGLPCNTMQYPDMIFVQNFTLPDFQAKNFTPQKCVICDIFLANQQRKWIKYQ